MNIERKPENFKISDYDNTPGQLDYIASIFQSRGVNFKDTQTYHLWSGVYSALVNSFFQKSGYGPETRLGQLVQIIACEGRQSDKLLKYLRIGTRKDVGENISNSLKQIRDVRDVVAEEIFGSEAKEFVSRIKQGYVCVPGKMGFQERIKIRNKNLDLIIDDVNSKFPLTSR